MLGAGDGAAFHQVGDHCQVGAGLCGAFVDAAHALPDLQADIPEKGEKALNGATECFVVGAAQQDQQVDVGVGVQLAAAVAADRQQGDVCITAPVEALPGADQDLIDEPGTVFDQAADVAALAKACVEYFSGLFDGLLECRDGTGLERQFRLEL